MKTELLQKMRGLDYDPGFPAERAQPIKMLVLDVDGVLTDGGLYYNDEGLALKRFDVQDGLGIKLAQRAGMEIVIISGMESEALRKRARDLGIEECHAGRIHKLPVMSKIMEARGLGWENLAYVGDDVIDLPILCRAGLALAVGNAQPEARAVAHYVAPKDGGHGAVRWLIRHILIAQNKLDGLVSEFISQDDTSKD